MLLGSVWKLLGTICGSFWKLFRASRGLLAPLAALWGPTACQQPANKSPTGRRKRPQEAPGDPHMGSFYRKMTTGRVGSTSARQMSKPSKVLALRMKMFDYEGRMGGKMDPNGALEESNSLDRNTMHFIERKIALHRLAFPTSCQQSANSFSNKWPRKEQGRAGRGCEYDNSEGQASLRAMRPKASADWGIFILMMTLMMTPGP